MAQRARPLSPFLHYRWQYTNTLSILHRITGVLLSLGFLLLIAARGLDVESISHVINFDMPSTAEAYTHRIGRTGRMTRLGAALSLITQEDLPMLRTIERLLGRTLERRQQVGEAVR